MLKVSHISKTFTGGIIKKTRVEAVKDVSLRYRTENIRDRRKFRLRKIDNREHAPVTDKAGLGTIEIDGTIQIIFQHPETSLDPAKRSDTA